jgi:hypothetical protein
VSPWRERSLHEELAVAPHPKGCTLKGRSEGLTRGRHAARAPHWENGNQERLRGWTNDQGFDEVEDWRSPALTPGEGLKFGLAAGTRPRALGEGKAQAFRGQCSCEVREAFRGPFGALGSDPCPGRWSAAPGEIGIGALISLLRGRMGARAVPVLEGATSSCAASQAGLGPAAPRMAPHWGLCPQPPRKAPGRAGRALWRCLGPAHPASWVGSHGRRLGLARPAGRGRAKEGDIVEGASWSAAELEGAAMAPSVSGPAPSQTTGDFAPAPHGLSSKMPPGCGLFPQSGPVRWSWASTLEEGQVLSVLRTENQLHREQRPVRNG